MWSMKKRCSREAVRNELRNFIKEFFFKRLKKPRAAQMRKALMVYCLPWKREMKGSKQEQWLIDGLSSITMTKKHTRQW